MKTLDDSDLGEVFYEECYVKVGSKNMPVMRIGIWAAKGMVDSWIVEDAIEDASSRAAENITKQLNEAE